MSTARIGAETIADIVKLKQSMEFKQSTEFAAATEHSNQLMDYFQYGKGESNIKTTQQTDQKDIDRFNALGASICLGKSSIYSVTDIAFVCFVLRTRFPNNENGFVSFVLQNNEDGFVDFVLQTRFQNKVGAFVRFVLP